MTKNQSIPNQSDLLTSKADKKSLRAVYRRKLNAMSLSQRKQKTEKINQMILGLPLWRQARFIAVYQAFRQEPSLSSFYSVWKNKICFPKIEDQKLSFYNNKDDLWEKNQFHILEPIPKEKNKVDLKNISVFLIPGLAFDRQGGRLGRGCAYYDKTLSTIKRKCNLDNFLKQVLFIGVAFIEQINQIALPLSSQDVLMDCLVTDQFILWPLSLQEGGN